MRISFAPINKGNDFTREWLQWFSSVGNAITGLWGVQGREFTDLPPNSDVSYLSYSGREITILLQWVNGVEFQNSKLVLDSSDLSVIAGKLLIFDDDVLVGTADAVNKEISFPDLVISGSCLVQGTLITKVPKGG